MSAALFRRPWLRAGLLLSGPAAWFVLIYLGALFLLFLSALWSVDAFSGKIVHSWTLSNFETLVNVPAYRTIAERTVGIAAAVTLTDAILAVPFAFFAARIASWSTVGLYARLFTATTFIDGAIPANCAGDPIFRSATAPSSRNLNPSE